MKKTRILTIVICFLIAIASFGFAACELPNSGSKHNYDSEWTYNETEHCHKCTDEGCNEVSDKAKHNFVDGTCSVCQAKKPEDLSTADLFINLEKSLVNLNNSEGFNVTIGGKNASVCYPIEFKETNIPAKIAVDADLELFIGKDADGKLAVNGAGKLAIDVDKNTTEEQFKDLSNDFFRINFDAAVIVKGENAYVQVKGEGEAQDKFFSVMNDSTNYSKTITLDEIKQQLKAAISHIVRGKYYAEEEFDIIPTDTTFLSLISMAAKEVLPSVMAELNKALTPVINTVYAKSEEAISKYIDLCVENSFILTETDNGYILKQDFEKMKQLSKDMLDLTVAQYIDKYCGEGTVDNVGKALNTLLDTKISQILTYCETFLGVTVDDIVAEINKIIAIVLDNETIASMLPEGTTASDYTVEKLLNVPEGTTVKTFLLSIVGDKTICDIITQAAEISKDDITGYIEYAINYIKENTYLDILSKLISDSVGTEIDFTEQKNIILATTNDMIDIISEIISYELEIGKDGSFTSSSAKITLNAKILEKIANNANFAEIANMLNGLSPDVTVTVSVSKGEFKNALKIDYEKIIDSITGSEAAAA